ncbi:hypothetical protein Agub_g8666 [Astrephomene gubernaculifera]|uniref:Protein kinase domain-containing protein n=1 Tax=Astrephomene gubernaculifera TaxID=47775 RepID=A0AAD3DS89_9CHLO|nr:hypothetical protein Agub_g8666 [Astrephomene gubernaculifera]
MATAASPYESQTAVDQLGIITEDATAISMSVCMAAQHPSNGSAARTSPASREDGLTTATMDGALTKQKEEEQPVQTGLSAEEPSSTASGLSKPVSVTASSKPLALRLTSAFPSWFWVALAVFVVVEVLAVTGSVYYARGVNTEARRAAIDITRTSARSIETLLDTLVAPMKSLANLVMTQPHWPTLNATFPTFAEAIYTTNPYYQVELCPYGVVGAMALPWLNLTGQAYWEFLLSFDFGLDLLNPRRGTYQDELDSILQDGNVILMAPWFADGELSEGAFVVRYSIFLPPGEWDMPTPNSFDACPRDICYTQDGRKFWGFANACFAWKTVRKQLSTLTHRGLLYTLAPDHRSANQSYLAFSDPLPSSDCEVVSVDVYGWMSWTFCVEPEGGFGPHWRAGLLVGVTALAVLLAVLTALVLRSRTLAITYLDRQLELNRQLAVAKEEAEEGRRVIEAEKRVMDALLQRQRNLIELFGKEDELLASVGAEGAVDGSEATLAARQRLQLAGCSRGSNLSRESAAMDRIEAVRRQLTVGRTNSKLSSTVNEVKLHEMLGEGTFGKVYRGVWRGTDVAVKTMVLPANMSGAEKREKMAIMEAAISSSLAHPNIVQTYTYFIKTVREEAAAEEEAPPAPAAGILVGAGSSSTSASALGHTFDEPAANKSASPSAQAVHGYEVRLVLEFCDRGCLRDALDGDAFLTSSGVNYRGVLDTAADIAKAMLHLHCADVLHGDLKARNVMLKSSGTEGRGVICKVADFGLAVKMDTVEQTHMSGMYQGTLTHMAPELLLQGRMSKAADVYAFGVTLWELFTGGHAFQGVPRALLGHQITQERRRPPFPPFVPEAYARLAAECWAHRAEDRPTFEVILERLAAMRDTVPGAASPLATYNIGSPPVQASGAGAGAGTAAGGAGAPPGGGALPKLSDGQIANANCNPVFDASGTGSGTRGLLLASTGVESSGGSGSSINWLFARNSHRSPLAAVQEDDRELDVSSQPLPLVPWKQLLQQHHGQQQQQQQQQQQGQQGEQKAGPAQEQPQQQPLQQQQAVNPQNPGQGQQELLGLQGLKPEQPEQLLVPPQGMVLGGIDATDASMQSYVSPVLQPATVAATAAARAEAQLDDA